MTYARFTAINASLCFVTDEVNVQLTALKKTDPTVSRTFKIDPFLKPIWKNSQRLYRMPKIVTLDEMMMPFKGLTCVYAALLYKYEHAITNVM